MPSEDQLNQTVLASMVPPAGSRLTVVGGCGGMGRVLVRAGLEIGLDIAVVDLARSFEEFPAPDGVTPVACDATDQASVASAFAQIEETWGAIDHLVNFVGFTKERTPVEEMELGEWQEIIDGCLTSAFLVARHGIPLLRRGDGPTLINTSSTFGVLVRQVGYGPYAASKAAIINLTRALSTECAPEIRVNAIAPGLVDTEFLAGGTGRQRREGNLDFDAIVEGIPMKRIGRPEDIVATALFLASPAASYVTAQTIHVNGGLWS